MTEQLIRRPISQNEWLVVVASLVAASALANLWSWRHDAMLNYGDAVAHLHIARRVFDSHRPGLSATWFGVATVPAFAPDSIRCGLRMVGQWHCGNDSIGAGLYRRVRRNLSPRALLARTFGSSCSARVFCLESESPLSADHGNDRATVPLPDGLACGLAGGVARSPE